MVTRPRRVGCFFRRLTFRASCLRSSARIENGSATFVVVGPTRSFEFGNPPLRRFQHPLERDDHLDQPLGVDPPLPNTFLDALDFVHGRFFSKSADDTAPASENGQLHTAVV